MASLYTRSQTSRADRGSFSQPRYGAFYVAVAIVYDKEKARTHHSMASHEPIVREEETKNVLCMVVICVPEAWGQGLDEQDDVKNVSPGIIWCVETMASHYTEITAE